ncbi:LURP-one-related/scramblase family protein [Vagococcus acidifermentans]|uniref:Uncharacterized protein n=1 Tax=Vagococcus acidifermentans TaxID=564710 RepID=A0A430B0N6_9ENTE|nr:hypothetical protein [Vagococcus acidifermentans]RSU13782.1 hypothetical protein CBF27_02460 [Vagococcus acidifermentans]
MKELILDCHTSGVRLFNQTGDTCFTVTNDKALPTRQQWSIYDTSHRRIGTIKKIRNHFGLYHLPKFLVHVEGYQDVWVQKEMSELKSVFSMTGEAVAIEGWLSDTFKLLKGELPIADITKSKHTYKITVVEEKHLNLVVCLMVCLSLVLS